MCVNFSLPRGIKKMFRSVSAADFTITGCKVFFSSRCILLVSASFKILSFQWPAVFGGWHSALIMKLDSVFQVLGITGAVYFIRSAVIAAKYLPLCTAPLPHPHMQV